MKRYRLIGDLADQTTKLWVTDGTAKIEMNFVQGIHTETSEKDQQTIELSDHFGKLFIVEPDKESEPKPKTQKSKVQYTDGVASSASVRTPASAEFSR